MNLAIMRPVVRYALRSSSGSAPAASRCLLLLSRATILTVHRELLHRNGTAPVSFNTVWAQDNCTGRRNFSAPPCPPGRPTPTALPPNSACAPVAPRHRVRGALLQRQRQHRHAGRQCGNENGSVCHVTFTNESASGWQQAALSLRSVSPPAPTMSFPTAQPRVTTRPTRVRLVASRDDSLFAYADSDGRNGMYKTGAASRRRPTTPPTTTSTWSSRLMRLPVARAARW